MLGLYENRENNIIQARVWLVIIIIPVIALHTIKTSGGAWEIYVKHHAVVTNTAEAPVNERVLPYYLVEALSGGDVTQIVVWHIVLNALLLALAVLLTFQLARKVSGTDIRGLLAAAVLGQLLMLTSLHVGGTVIESWFELVWITWSANLLYDLRNWFLSSPAARSPEIPASSSRS